MATKYSFDEPTNREDLSDVITKLWADDTPITSMCGKTKATGTKHEFPEDELAAAKANAQVEGADITAVAATSRTRKSNHTQIYRDWETRAYSIRLERWGGSSVVWAT